MKHNTQLLPRINIEHPIKNAIEFIRKIHFLKFIIMTKTQSPNKFGGMNLIEQTYELLQFVLQ